MTDQRNSLLDRLGSHEAVTFGKVVLIGGDGKGEYRHGVRMGEVCLMGA